MMRASNNHEAEAAANGEPIEIAESGGPMVKVVAAEDTATPRLGFMRGEFAVPDDFTEIGRVEIDEMFYGKIFPAALRLSRRR